MEEERLLQVLLKRAQARIANKQECDNDTCLLALKEALELVGDALVPQMVILDIAWCRLKLFLKIELNGEDEMLYDKALKILKEAPLKQDGVVRSNLYYKVVKKRSVYD